MNHGLSVIIPAFNEADRLPRYLEEVRGHMTAAFGREYEVIVVDDGSDDDTSGAVICSAEGWPEFRLLRHPVNRGKGAAVRTGMLASVGLRVLFADADGATPIEEEAKLRSRIDAGADVAVGSRLLRNPGDESTRAWHRDLAGKAFAAVGRTVMGVNQLDTQCGFKMFRADAGRRLFEACTVDGYLFDLYILAMAERSGLRVAEVPVLWSEQPGSKIHLLKDSLGMLSGLWRLRSRVLVDVRAADVAPAARAF